MKKYVIILSLLLIMGFVAQQAFAVSEATVLFLMITPGARQASMGESFAAVSNDAYAAFWNPAGLAYSDNWIKREDGKIVKKHVTFMHVNWLPGLTDDLFYEFLAFATSIEGVGTIGFNVVYLNLGEQQRTSVTGRDLGTFNSSEYAITASYGTTVTDNLAMGVALRFIYSNLSPVGAGTERGTGQASGFSFDVGLLYTLPFLNNKLNWGLNISNMGPKIAYIDEAQADPLPTNLRMGIAYKLVDQKFNKVTITADINKLLVTPHSNGKADPFHKALITSWYDDPIQTELDKITRGVGIEYWYSDLFALRAGYYHDKEGNVKYPTFGAGIRFNNYGFDFGYAAAREGHPLSGTMRFSLNASF